MMTIRTVGNFHSIYNRINTNIGETLQSNKKKTSMLDRVGKRYEAGNSKKARKHMKNSQPKCKLEQQWGGSTV